MKNELTVAEEEIRRKNQLIMQLMEEKEGLERVLERERQIQLELRNEMVRIEEKKAGRGEGGLLSDLRKTVKTFFLNKIT